MATIHRSATIDPQAELAEGVTIGPGCVIDGPVVIGEGTRLISQVCLNGPLKIGRDNTLYPFVCVGFDPQHRQYEGSTAGVTIGDRNVLRESVTIHSAMDKEKPTELGDDNYLMTNAHVGHDVCLGHRVTMASGALIGGHARIDDDAILSGNSAVHQFCRVGRLSMLGGLSTATRDLPPFMTGLGLNTVIALNTVGLRRGGVPGPARDQLKRAFVVLYKSGLSSHSAADKLTGMAEDGRLGAIYLTELAEFVRGSKRGISRMRHKPNQVQCVTPTA